MTEDPLGALLDEFYSVAWRMEAAKASWDEQVRPHVLSIVRSAQRLRDLEDTRRRLAPKQRLGHFQ